MEINVTAQIQLYMMAGMFALGVFTFLAGVVTLLIGVWGLDQKNILSQTSKIAQKGLTEEIAGLVGNATVLITAINDLVRTRNGIGFLLILAGAGLMIVAYWLTITQGI
jgi:hypothetical protein